PIDAGIGRPGAVGSIRYIQSAQPTRESTKTTENKDCSALGDSTMAGARQGPIGRERELAAGEHEHGRSAEADPAASLYPFLGALGHDLPITGQRHPSGRESLQFQPVIEAHTRVG